MAKVLLGIVGAIVLVAIVLGLTVSGAYNSLVRLDQGTQAQWAQVENVYQRRSDLVPNLVATVQGAANFEKETLTAVTQARASVGRATITPGKAPTDAQSLAQYEAAQNQLGAALQRLLVVSERYPELKANSSFRDLQAQLEGTENRITVARGRFNDSAQSYNTAVRKFPTNLIAGMFGFQAKAYFKAVAPGAEQAPKVNFNFGKAAP